MSNLFSFTTPDLLDAVLLTHEHVDHIADYVGIHHYRRYSSKPRKRLDLYLPFDALMKLKGLISDSAIAEVASVHLLDGPGTFNVGPLTIATKRALHPVETYAVRVEASSGSIGYTADTGPDPSLAGFFHGVDILIAESTWLEPYLSAPTGLHLNSLEVDQLAVDSGAGLTLISHVSYPNSPYVALENALEFRPDATLDVAEDGQTHWTGSRSGR